MLGWRQTGLREANVTDETNEERHVRIYKEVACRLGRDLSTWQVSSHPCVRLVAKQVAQAFHHASVVGIVHDTHPLSREFHQHREWLRIATTQSLLIPLETSWDEINLLAGILPMTQYESEERFFEAYHFGEMKHLTHPDANRILRQLTEIKFRSWKLKP